MALSGLWAIVSRLPGPFQSAKDALVRSKDALVRWVTRLTINSLLAALWAPSLVFLRQVNILGCYLHHRFLPGEVFRPALLPGDGPTVSPDVPVVINMEPGPTIDTPLFVEMELPPV